ncbi:MAG TPA: T9SS type A sorting domain-containing protein [Bacteroidetes bacterium]|nr:hypothetical protein BMS3Bbin04_01794 [bacterium BMS3Bbin04]HDO66230.1 T9SS type A sorting domain-containing protein [Bacteroidota bacterium]HEX05355.1 T9SS type A sorting domain-containing protein [Bacteroidota bacterium]
MKRFIKLNATLLLLILPMFAFADPWADQVIEVSYGPGAGFGQDYFPENVLGPPDTSASVNAPSQSPEQLLALGSGGYITLLFDGDGIVNGPGPDFTVFENAFTVNGGSFVFRETAFVAVSEDGVSWHEFPWDGITFSGLAGVSPTNGQADPTDPNHSGGDSFDLENLGLEVARFVRLTDTDDLVADGGPSFDLDAVVALHSNQQPQRPALSASELQAWPNPFNTVIAIQVSPDARQIQIFDCLGRLVDELSVNQGSPVVWNAPNLSSGVFFARVTCPEFSQTLRLVKVR